MEVLGVLEQKVVLLADFVEKLHKQNDELRAKVEALQKETAELRAENAHFVEENTHLSTKLQELLLTVDVENKRLSELDSERDYAKQVVDELIQTIENLVDKENQL